MGGSVGKVAGTFAAPFTGGMSIPGAGDLLGLGALEGAPGGVARNVNIRGAGGEGIDVVRDPRTGEVVSVKQIEGEFGKSFRLGGERIGTGLGGQAETILGQVAGPEDIGRRSFEAAQARLQPGFEEEERKIRNRLAGQGIPVGSEAFNAELDRLERSRNAALQQAAFGAEQAGRTARATDVAAIGSLLQSRGGFAPGKDLSLLGGFAGLKSGAGTLAQEQQEFQAQQQRLGAVLGLASSGIRGAATGGAGA